MLVDAKRVIDGCCNGWPQTARHRRTQMDYSSAEQRFDVHLTGLRSRCPQGWSLWVRTHILAFPAPRAASLVCSCFLHVQIPQCSIFIKSPCVALSPGGESRRISLSQNPPLYSPSKVPSVILGNIVTGPRVWDEDVFVGLECGWHYSWGLYGDP